jgi:acyl-homoserine lactone acylase PvdQ
MSMLPRRSPHAPWLGPVLAITLAAALIQSAATRATAVAQTQSERIPVLIARSAPASSAFTSTTGIDYEVFRVVELDAQTAASLRYAPGVALRDDFTRIFLNAGTLDTDSAEAQTLRAAGVRAAAATRGRQLHLVQFAGPVKPEWFAALLKTGVEVIDAVPSNAYLIYGDAAALHAVISLASAEPGRTAAGSGPIVRWHAAHQDAWRLHPALDRLNGGPLGIQLVHDDARNPATLALIAAHSSTPVVQQRMAHYVNIRATLPAAALTLVAAQPDVIAIQPSALPRKFDEIANQIIAGRIAGNGPAVGDYMDWLADAGFAQAQFTASNFVVDVTDSGLDNGTQAPNHFALYTLGNTNLNTRVAYNRLIGTANSGSSIAGLDGHGTINAHIIGGYVLSHTFPHADASGFRYGLGVAPFVRLGSSVIFDPDNYTNPNLTTLQSRAYADGARISSNSWGSAEYWYTFDAQTFDYLTRDAQPSNAAVPAAGNQAMVIIVAAGNKGPDAYTVGSPATAKNVIAVGGTEGVRPFGAADGCTIGDSGANSFNDIISFSSRGPTYDGRTKPDIMAPATHVTGGVYQSPTPGITGTASSGFTASGVCGGPSASPFWPTGQQWTSSSSGTSHATPLVAGGAALLRQHFVNAGFAPPSPAMTKAYMLAAARYLTGAGANDTLFSRHQGMGMLDLGAIFTNSARIVRDEQADDLFTASGQARVFSTVVGDSGQPVRITLAWTDAPGSTAAAPYVNNLDLSVTVNGQTYLGNMFNGAHSVADGYADQINNVESVFLPAGLPAGTPVIVRVVATALAGNGVPGNATWLDQDFALVGINLAGSTSATLTPAGMQLVDEGFLPANGAIDPGETVALALGIQNSGMQDAPSLSAALLAGNGVLPGGMAQLYGAVQAGGMPVTRTFSVAADPLAPCGALITPTLSALSGATPLNNVPYALHLGSAQLTAWQNFDAGSAPALPAGWISATTVPNISWQTITSVVDSAPNAAFAPAHNTVSDLTLTSPAFTSTLNTRVSFRHRLSMEVTYDGAVLEVAIGAGAWTDILTAGGTFVTGAYNTVISTGYSNPLAGRRAWSDIMSGFGEVTISLPASAAGQSVRLRWRVASDSGVGAGGYTLDSIQLQAGHSCAAAGVTVRGLDGTSTSESGDSAAFSLSLNKAPIDSVQLSLASSNATEGVASGSVLTFTPANWHVTQVVTVTGVDDAEQDGAVQYALQINPAISNDPAYDGLKPDDVALTNLDNDSPGVIVIGAPITTTESGLGGALQFRLQTQPEATIYITATVSDATEASANPLLLAFTPENWASPRSITINGVDDLVLDGPRSLSVTFEVGSADPRYAGLAIMPVTVTNMDNEVAGITVQPGYVLTTTEAGGSAAFSVVLDVAPNSVVTVAVSSSDTSEGRLSASALVFDNTNWSVPQTVTVTGQPDLAADGDRVYAIVTAPAVDSAGGYTGVDPDDLTVVNLDVSARRVHLPDATCEQVIRIQATMRLIKRVLLVAVALVVGIAAAGGSAFFYFTRRPFPQTSGVARLPGLSAPVEVIRDRYGVPHIFADTPEDLFKAQGYVHAQDRFFQMEFSRRIGQGRISELFGAGALGQDKFIRTLGWHRVAEEEVKLLPSDGRIIMDSYAAGVNAYALPNAQRLGFEFNVLALNGRNWTPEPWTAVNSLTWGKAMAFNLGDNGDTELLRAALIAKGGVELAEAVLPPYPADFPVIVPTRNTMSGGHKTDDGGQTAALGKPSSAFRPPSSVTPDAAITLARLSRNTSEAIGLPKGSDIGSNNWVLAGAKTITGKPILSNDPHLGIQMPSIWYQVGLHCRTVNPACPYDVTGVSFPGVPGVILGHNRRIAWGVTNGTVDTQDYFIEKANPANPDEFEFMGKYEPAQIREEVIRVAGRETPELLRVRVTRHGPIMNDVEAALKDKAPMAFSWAALRPGAILQSVLAINRAQNWEQFREALKLWDTPSQNFVYADVDGNIGYQFPGNIPIRAKGDGTLPVDGWTGENEWTGFIPFDQLPSRYNPSEGFIVTANNAVVDDKSSVLLMKRDWDFGYRAKRIVDLLQSRDKLGVDDMKTIHFDSYAIFADELLPLVFEAIPAGSDSRLDAALNELRAWDKRHTRDSRGALIFEMFRLKLAQATFGDELGELSGDAIGVGTATWTALRNIMRDGDARWWDNTTTGDKESREQIMQQALRAAIYDLEKRQGADMSKWQWGAMHQATFRNQTLGQSGVAPIEAIFNRGPIPADGGTGLVNALGHRPSDFAVRSVPSMRMIVDLADFQNSLLVHTTGQSGHAFHRNYDDMIRPWLNGEYNPMIWTRDGALASGGETLKLMP